MISEIQQLKLEILTHGLILTAAATLRIKGINNQPLTLHDYASTSGISLIIDNDIWVNAPIVEHNPNFVTKPSCQLDFRNNDFVLIWGELEISATPVVVPSYHEEIDTNGDRYTSYGITHTDRVRISPIEGCSFVCTFCDSPYKLSYRKKSVEGLISVIAKALNDHALPARHILVSGGVPKEEDYGYLKLVYEQVAETFPAVPIDIMMAPLPGLLEPRHLKDIGINELVLNLELFNEKLAHKLMPKKAEISRHQFLKSIENAVNIFGVGKVRSLLLVGLESIEDTISAVKALSERGCETVLSPFRPDPATPLRNMKPPLVDLLRETYERSVEMTAKYNMKLGPKCIPCQHNTLTFPDGSDYYIRH